MFLFFDENICCGCSLEAPRRGASNEYLQHTFCREIRKISILFAGINVPYLPQFDITDGSCGNCDQLRGNGNRHTQISNPLNLYHTRGKTSRQQINNIFFLYSSQKIGFGISCKLSPKETIWMKCQRLFPGKNNKNISNCHLLKFLPSMLNVKPIFTGSRFNAIFTERSRSNSNDKK